MFGFDREPINTFMYELSGHPNNSLLYSTDIPCLLAVYLLYSVKNVVCEMCNFFFIIIKLPINL